MRDFAAVIETISRATNSGQIGTPAAVRIVAHLSPDHGRVESDAGRALAAAERWLAARVEHVTCAGSARVGQISTLARLERGRSAVVATGSCGVGSPLLEIVVFGSRGSISWEGHTGAFPDAEADDCRGDAELIARAKALQAQVAAALAAGSAVGAGERLPHSQPPAAPLAPPYGVLLVAGDYTHQPNYAEALAADERCRLVGLTDTADITPRRRKLNEQLAARLGIPLLDELDAALERDDVHIVSVCAEPVRRGPIIVRAAQAGKHLYLDKPLAGSLADLDCIVAAVDKARVVAHMFSLVRSDASTRARRVIASDWLGELSAVHFDTCFAKGPAGTASLASPRRESEIPEYFELADSKRELTNVGVYPTVLMLWLVGRPVRRVTATTGNYFFAEHERNGMEDFGQMLLECDGGLAATVSAGRTGWRSHPSGGLNRTYLVGSQHTAVVDAHRPRAAVWSDAETWTAPPRDPNDPMGMWAAPAPNPYQPAPKRDWFTPADDALAADVRSFLDCIEQGRASDVSAAVAAHATEVLLAAYRSAAGGRSISLPLER